MPNVQDIGSCGIFERTFPRERNGVKKFDTRATLTALAALLPILALAAAAEAAADTLKVATWDLVWLTGRTNGDPALPADVHARSDADVAALRGYARALDADVIALQGIDGPDLAARIFTPDRYDLIVTADDVLQRTGFAIRHGIHALANPDVTELDVYAGKHQRLRSGADVTIDLPRITLRLLSVDLKAGCRHADLDTDRSRPCQVLREQAEALGTWIAARGRDGEPFLVLGGFNRAMDGDDGLWARLDRAAPLVRATTGRASPCWGGGAFIDHILAGGPAGAWMQPDSLRVLVYRETDDTWKRRLSDHCPVSVRLRLPD